MPADLPACIPIAEPVWRGRLGLVGLAAALSGAGNVIVTDLPENVQRLQDGIDQNADVLSAAGGCNIEAASLPFGDLEVPVVYICRPEGGCAQAVYSVAPEGCDLVLGLPHTTLATCALDCVVCFRYRFVLQSRLV